MNSVCDGPKFLCTIAWASTWLAFHSCSYDFFIDWCRYSPSKPCIHKWRMCYASCRMKTLMQSSKQISVWVTSNKIMKCEFPCISTWTTVTGTEGKQHVAVFDVYVRISRSFSHSWVLLRKVWVHVTTRFIVMSALLGKCVTPFGSDAYRYRKLFAGCVTFSAYFCCNEGIALWRGCIPVSFHPVQHRSQYRHEEPTRLLNGQNQMWGR